MARIALMALYDDKATGIRIIGSYLKSLGHECLLIFLKMGREFVVDEITQESTNFFVLQNGALLSSCYDISPLSDSELRQAVRQLREFNPDILGLSSRTCFEDLSERLVSEFRKELPHILYVGGGFGPTMDPKKWAGFVDIVVRGDGEDTMADIAERVDKGLSLAGIANTAYMLDGEVKLEPLRAPEKDISRYPIPFMPGEHSVYIDESMETTNVGRELVYDIMVGRGCIGNCAYCSEWSWRAIYRNEGFTMPPRRMRSVDVIMEELHRAKNQGHTQVFFRDEFLVASVKVMYELFGRYKKEIGLPFYFHVHPHTAKANPEFLDFLVDAGLNRSGVGIQSGNEDFVVNVYKRKKQTNEGIIEFTRALNKAKVGVNYQFIWGNPVEPEESLQHNYDLLRAIAFNPERDNINIFLFEPLPYTQIVNEYGLEKLSGYDRAKYHLESLKMTMRAFLSDEEFEKCLDIDNVKDMQDFMMDSYADLTIQGYSIELFSHMRHRLRRRVADKLRGRPVYLWGYSGGYRDTKELLSGATVQGIFDNDPAKQGTFTEEGIRIHAPEELLSMPRLPVVITSAYHRKIKEQIRGMDESLVAFYF